MWKIAVGFALFAALALFILSKGGEIDMGGEKHGDTTHMAIDGHVFSFTETSPFPTVDKSHDPSRARAPVAGVVAQVLVAVGEVVQAGQQLACVEAMKMEMWLHAGAAGTVRAVHIKAKDSVAAGAVLIELETTP